MVTHTKTRKSHMNPLQVSLTANAVIVAILLVFSLICVLPIILIYIGSFTSEKAITLYGFSFFPKIWSLEAFRMLFNQSLNQILTCYKNTLFLTVAGTALSLIMMTMYAYTLARKEFVLRQALSFFAYFTMLFSGGLVPSYIINTTIFGFRDTMWALLLPSLCGAYNIIVLRTFFTSMDTESLIEAAKLDGAGEFRIYSQIILPISKPALATIGLFQAIAYFSLWFPVMLYIDNRSMWTIQYILQRVMKDIVYLRANPELAMSDVGLEMLQNMPNESAKMALTVIAMTPVLAFYPFFQKYFIKGLTLGSIKG